MADEKREQKQTIKSGDRISWPDPPYVVELEGPDVLIYIRAGHERHLTLAQVEKLAETVASRAAKRGKCGFVVVGRWDGTITPPVQLVVMTKDAFEMMLARGRRPRQRKRVATPERDASRAAVLASAEAPFRPDGTEPDVGPTI